MQELVVLIGEVTKKLFGEQADIVLTRPEEQFGDYSTNVALQLAKKVDKNPREVAEAIAADLKHEFIKKTDVAGPGFINITLTDQALLNLTKTENPKSLAGKVVVAEYSDPSAFKVLHAGHLYTSVVGDAIANLLENAGAITHRVNFGGDVGMHVGKTMWAILRELGGENPEKLNEVPADGRADWMSARYVEGNKAFEEDEQAKMEIVEVNKRIYGLFTDTDHDSLFAKVYWTARTWSYDYFDQFYERIGTKFEKYYPESDVVELGLKTVKEQLAKGVFVESDGAIIFKGEDYGLHTRVFINSEGLPTYEAKDVGLIMTKWNDYQFDKSVVITGNEQEQYMAVVLKAVEQFEPKLVAATSHLTHGIVKLSGGQKMSSRKGNILRAVDVLDVAHEANKKATGKDDQNVVLGAVKYAFLKQRTGGDIIYDPEESVSLEGNSGPYLQYAHARAKSILARASGSPRIPGDQLRSDAHRTIPYDSASVLAAHPGLHDAAEPLNTGKLEPGERSLVRTLSEYSEVIDRATAELMPHHVCTYLYELAQTFNRFYENNRVIGDAREAERLALVTQYAKTLKTGLELLGIHAPEQM